MKQRLALARALLPNPRLLLLDEPFTGLDQQSSEFLLSKILDLKGEVTFVLATHELERAYEMADKFLILKNGRQLFFGVKEEMKMDLHHFYQNVTA
jgi:heme exporter protein A